MCPYHAWTYDLDGRLKTATEREFGVHQSKLGLHPVPLEECRRACCSSRSATIRSSFDRVAADVGEKMKHQGLEDAKLAKSVRYTVKANWKLIFENNRECYHCNTAHPEYVQGTYDTARFSPQTLPEVERAGAARERALRPHGARRRDGLVRDDRRLLARGAHAAEWKAGRRRASTASRSRR